MAYTTHKQLLQNIEDVNEQIRLIEIEKKELYNKYYKQHIRFDYFNIVFGTLLIAFIYFVLLYDLSFRQLDSWWWLLLFPLNMFCLIINGRSLYLGLKQLPIDKKEYADWKDEQVFDELRKDF